MLAHVAERHRRAGRVHGVHSMILSARYQDDARDYRV
jgi:hypothetical protein